MGQLQKIEPLTDEQRRETIEKRKQTLKFFMKSEEYRNIFESDDDPYYWIDHYREQRERQRCIKEYGYDPASGG